MVTEELKHRILAAIAGARENFGGSDNKFATSIGISASQYSRIKRGEIDRVISDSAWISIARKLDVSPNAGTAWKTAVTPVFTFITAQLEMCQEESVSTLLCDLSDIGKSYTAKVYCKSHKNAVYVDCSQVKSRQKLIRYIANGLGLSNTGRYADVYGNLVYYIKTIETPLIILDEAGDLSYEAFLEIKALWNATENACGYYMMGADGLKEKIRRAINCKKVGYTEVFSRFGRRYSSILPDNIKEAGELLRASAAMIIKANTGSSVKEILNCTLGEDNVPSLRRIQREIVKARG